MKAALLATVLLIFGVSDAFASPTCSDGVKTSGTAQCFVIR